DIGRRDTQLTRHANGPVSMKRGRIPWRSNDVRTSFEDVANRSRGAGFPSSRDGQERWSKGGGEKGRGTGPRAFGHQPALARRAFASEAFSPRPLHPRSRRPLQFQAAVLRANWVG